MNDAYLTVLRWLHVGAAVHAVTLSEDGRHMLAGSDLDVSLRDRADNVLYSYKSPSTAFRAVAATADLTLAIAATQSGDLYRLNPFRWAGQEADWPELIRREVRDLHSLSLAPGADRIAIGHLSAALTLTDAYGHVRWRRHPDDRNATDGKSWAVAFGAGGDLLYVGSSSERYLLAALDPADGRPLAGVRQPGPVTRIAALPSPLAVAAVVTQRGECHLLAYPPDLRRAAWRYECDLGELATAIGCDPAAGLLALGTNTGRLVLLNAADGALLAQNDTLCATVLTVSLAAGRYIAAGLVDGQIAYLEYVPPEEEEVRL